MMEIRLLGTFEIRRDGVLMKLPSRAAQSLLAYLVLNPGVAHRREKLAGLFWPESSDERARASLRQELWRIRRALSAASAPDILIADDLTVAFRRSAETSIDVDELAGLAEDASSPELKACLGRYGGELLPGFYEDWAVLERERIQLLFEQRLSRLLELLEGEKHWTEMVQWAERWLALGQNPDAAYRALMVAYAGLGDRAKVLATYERCVDALRALGLEPSEEIRSLIEARRPAVNLPRPVTSLIGREAQVREVSSLLLAARLLTLTGTGGVGKTRLAIEVAHWLEDRFLDGVFYLELAALRDPAMVGQRLASRLRLRTGATEQESVTDLLANYFHTRHALLVLDNCEHLIEACAQLADALISACPHLYILVTSREALRIASESPYRVPSLDVPSADEIGAPDALAQVDSVRLFIERACTRSRSFALTTNNGRHVAELCRRLDGIPLAIELAAARVGTLALDSMVEHLDDRFALLCGGLRTELPRHQTLRAMIDWSHELLSDAERILLRRLSVFAGGWTLDAAQKVAADATLAEADVLRLLPELVEKSLVVLDTARGRYSMLETIREYALDRLEEAGEEAALRTRHLGYYLELSEAADLAAVQSDAATAGLAIERDNLLSAFTWCERMEGGAQKGLLLIGATRLTWILVPDLDLGYRLARKFLLLPGTEPRNLSRCRALLTFIQMAFYTGRGTEPDVLAAAQESISIAREIGNGRRESQALNLYANLLAMAGKPRQALESLEEALQLARDLGLLRLSGKVLSDTADVLRGIRELAAAEAKHEESIAVIRHCDAPHDLILFLGKAASVAIATGNLTDARQRLLEGLKIMGGIPLGLAITSVPLQTSAFFLAAVGDWHHAAVLFGAAARQSELETWMLDPAERALHQRLMEQTQQALGESGFQAAFAEGRRLPSMKAIADAQDWLSAAP